MAYKLKLTVPYIFLCAVSNYLTTEELEVFKDELAKRYPKQDRAFFTLLKKHFDIERFRTAPFVWQDIWLYNYLMYDAPKKDLLKMYEREIILPMEKKFKELLTFLN